jgi:hypothetical protein
MATLLAKTGWTEGIWFDNGTVRKVYQAKHKWIKDCEAAFFRRFDYLPCVPKLLAEDGTSLTIPFYKYNHLHVSTMPHNVLLNNCEKLVQMVWNLHKEGVCHGDIWLGNLLMDDNFSPYLVDPLPIETLGQNFANSYDVAGNQSHPYHNGKPHKPSLKTLFKSMKIDMDPVEIIARQITKACIACSGSETYPDFSKNGYTYSSYDIPGLNIPSWRNTKERMAVYFPDDIDLTDKTVLDLGSNCGATSLWALQRGAMVLGLEENKDRVAVANDISCFAGYRNRSLYGNSVFVQKNIVDEWQVDKVDYVFMFAVAGRTGQERAICERALATGATILYESNHEPDVDEIVQLWRSLGKDPEILGHNGSPYQFPIRWIARINP